MKITKLELKNFKRFDDLTIDLTSLAEPAKLVLLIGTNGSGKSSVFDAFEFVNKYKKENIPADGSRPKDVRKLSSYYEKTPNKYLIVNLTTDSGYEFHNYSKSKSYLDNLPVNGFYGRTSIRQVPQLTRTYIGNNPSDVEQDADRPKMFIERDNRFENDVEDIMTLILKDVFNGGNLSTEVIRQRYIVPINKAFENIFGAEQSLTIRLISFIPPSQGKTAEILFEKGSSRIPYDYLSGGEKEIFNIILNLLARKKYFTDTIYFLDEIDLHLNTYLQKNLLKEITENWIPDNCQLWTASHSLGFIEYASEVDHAAIIDFDNLNFDIPQVIKPSPKNNFDIFEIAVSKEFLSRVLQGKQIVFSENTDTPLYNNLSLENTVFFNARDKNDVFYKTKNNPLYAGLVDRDYFTDAERTDLLSQYKNLFILNYYSIENYLYYPDNLDEYYKLINKDFDKEAYKQALMSERPRIKDKIAIGIAGARGGYQFYKENEAATKLDAFKSNSLAILQMFDSADFETFYKIFPAKDYGTKIKERQNLNPVDLAKTNWFKTKIEEVLKK
jgi:energy-coupling factor transporter ATP-binding protein EcfA2